MDRKVRITFNVSVLLLLFPSIANADAGVPLLFLTLPGMVLALIPIIFIEMSYLRKALNLPTSLALRISVYANLLSAIVGIPLTWLVSIANESVTGGIPSFSINSALSKFPDIMWYGVWLMPYTHEFHRMILTTMMWLLIPFYLVSCLVESSVAILIHRSSDRVSVTLAMLKANGLSYGFLAILFFLYGFMLWQPTLFFTGISLLLFVVVVGALLRW